MILWVEKKQKQNTQIVTILKIVIKTHTHAHRQKEVFKPAEIVKHFVLRVISNKNILLLAYADDTINKPTVSCGT